MLQKLFQVIFLVISAVADVLLHPLISAISTLFPDLSVGLNAMFRFLEYAITFFSFCWKFICIPQPAILALFSYFSVKYSIYVMKTAINFGVKIYQKFKP